MSEAKRLVYAEDILASIRDDDSIPGKVFARIKEHINNAPTADAEEVVHGWWRQNPYFKPVYTCSKCGDSVYSAIDPVKAYPYCHCGAKMDGTKREGE